MLCLTASAMPSGFGTESQGKDLPSLECQTRCGAISSNMTYPPEQRIRLRREVSVPDGRRPDWPCGTHSLSCSRQSSTGWSESAQSSRRAWADLLHGRRVDALRPSSRDRCNVDHDLEPANRDGARMYRPLIPRGICGFRAAGDRSRPYGCRTAKRLATSSRPIRRVSVNESVIDF
jgi:hypothetical protein